MRVLVLGVTGMLGHMVFQLLQANQTIEAWGTLRSATGLNDFPSQTHLKLIHGLDVIDEASLLMVFERVKPDVVINCIGVIKQLASANDPLTVLPINALLPHRLAKMCAISSARLIHISTDCVFSGKKGFYDEAEPSDAEDLYGKSKYIGELADLSHAITLRTSMIGHELHSSRSLVDWFLSQQGAVKGYTKAVFSGFPTVELARVICNYIIPNTDLSGLYHVAASPINKYALLKLIAERYHKEIDIIPEDDVMIDRSLNAKRFNQITGYIAPEWPLLIDSMFKARNI